MPIQVDQSHIDLAQLIEQETTTARFGKWSGQNEKRTCKSVCPWCGGTDRFAVVDSKPNQHFYCGIHGGQGCKRDGDAISFMQQWHNISFMEACRRLNLEVISDGKPLDITKREGKIYSNIDKKPCEEWRGIAEYFLRRCQQWLWSDIGKDALEELHQRGFTDDEIRTNGYGYNRKTLFDENVKGWGIADENVKAVWLPRGIVIPWYIGGDLWKLNIRRPLEDIDEDTKRTGKQANKYINVKGGANPLYHADSIKSAQPLVLFEGEFNADILAKVLAENDIENIATVATGSTGKGRADNWLTKIAKASPILISFDPDGAGAQAARDYWHKVLPQAVLWPSRGGDMNDMYQSGADVMKWLRLGLKIAGADLVKPTSNVASECEQFIQCFLSTPGHTLRVRDDGVIAIGVPDSMTDAEYNAIAAQVEQYKESITTYLAKRVA